MATRVLEESVKSIEEAERHSIQSRAGDDGSDIGAGIGGIGGGLLTYLIKSGELVHPWWSTQRDIDLRRFVKGSDHLSGAIALLTSKVINVPVEVQPRDMSLKAHIKQADDYNRRLLEESEFGLGWPTLISKWLDDWFVCDNGAAMEVIGGGNPDRPIKGPALGLAHLDSARLIRKKDSEYPLAYLDEDGQQYRLHRSRVAYASDQPSAIVEMRGVGFSSTSRCIHVSQNLTDISTFKEEKLGSRPFRGIMFTPGIPTDVVQATMEMASELMDNRGQRRYASIPILGGNDTNARFEMVSLSALPDGFDEETSTRLGMFTIALAFGVPIRWIWPAATSGATKADAMYQHIAGLGGGVGRVLKTLTYMLGGDPRGSRHTIGKFLPPHLKLVFDFQDDEQDRMQAEIAEKRMNVIEKGLGVGLLTLRTAREMALESGDLTQAQFNQMELAEGRLPSGEDVLTLFYTGDDSIKQMLELGVEDALDVASNDAVQMLEAIESRMAAVRDIISSAGSVKQKQYAKQAMAALNKLRDTYQEAAKSTATDDDISAQDDAADAEQDDQAREDKTPTDSDVEQEPEQTDEEEQQTEEREEEEEGEATEEAQKTSILGRAIERLSEEVGVLSGLFSRTDDKVWDRMSDVPKHLRTMNGATLSLAQVNHLSEIADGLGSTVDEPWAVARAQFQKLYRVEGNRWVRRKGTAKKAVDIFSEISNTLTGIGRRVDEWVKGGPGSGHHGHAGIPGKRGGSAPSLAGGDGVYIGDIVAYPGKFGRTKDQWSVAHEAGGPAGFEETPEEAVAYFLKMEKRSHEYAEINQRHRENVRKVMDGDDNAFQKLAPRNVGTRQAEALLIELGVPSKDASRIVGRMGIVGESKYGTIYRDPEELLKRFRNWQKKSGQKGGPGSGHHGHAGVPGKRGGSAPNSGSVSRDFFSTPEGNRIIGFDFNRDERNDIVDLLSDDKVRHEHLEGLTLITKEAPEVQGAGWDDEPNTAGQYFRSKKSIHLRPMGMSLDKRTLSHEFGHHLQHNWMHDTERGRTARDVFYRNFADFRTNVQMGLIDDDTLTWMGLRPYSATLPGELIADTWMVYQLGTQEQKDALAKHVLHVDSLEGLF